MQGYTTLVAETQEQLAGQGLVKPTHIFVQAGVGAFAAAVIASYAQLFGNEAPKAVVVEPRKAACLHHSLQIDDGKPHSVTGDLETIMAGLACGVPSPLAWKVLWNHADLIITAPDYVAAKGMRMYGVPLRDDPLVISGESGAVSLGALTFVMEHAAAAPLRDQLELDRSSEVLLINTEGNTDPDYFRNVVWDGVYPVPEAYRWHP
jgi:diaminopropionate ammonia-lyase